MSLSSLQLDAFAAVAKVKNFSLAAQHLHITQSALSQRILNLEEELGTTLLIRDPKGVRLSELGEKLLRYCQTRASIEEEFLSELKSPEAGQLAGVIRVAGFSTITRSLLLPPLTRLCQKYAKLQLELTSAEFAEIPALLESGQVEFAFLNQPHAKQGIHSHFLGNEENVLIRARGKKTSERFLDHDAADLTTADFFRQQSKKPKMFARHFLGDIYAILDAVAAGGGLAVVPKHLLTDLRGIEIVEGYKPILSPVYLLYFEQPYYTSLQKSLIQLFTEEVAGPLVSAPKSR